MKGDVKRHFSPRDWNVIGFRGVQPHLQISRAWRRGLSSVFLGVVRFVVISSYNVVRRWDIASSRLVVVAT